VIQEAVVNVVKHAQAKNLTVRLKHADNMMGLEINDDGRGFFIDHATIDRVNHSGFGLTAMRERMDRHGGELQVQSHPQRGTRILASVQVDQAGA
jgi:signal transduction histidine kinase